MKIFQNNSNKLNSSKSCVLFFFLDKEEPENQDRKIAPHTLRGIVFRHSQRIIS
jgi:hypothetical protein